MTTYADVKRAIPKSRMKFVDEAHVLVADNAIQRHRPAAMADNDEGRRVDFELDFEARQAITNASLDAANIRLADGPNTSPAKGRKADLVRDYLEGLYRERMRIARENIPVLERNRREQARMDREESSRARRAA